MPILAYANLERSSDNSMVKHNKWKKLKDNQQLLIFKIGDGHEGVAVRVFENQEELDFDNKRLPTEVIVANPLQGIEV